MTDIPRGAPCAFKVGQVWRDSRPFSRNHTVIAITAHPEFPVITQDDDGAVSAYTADGRWEADDRHGQWTLCTLVQDVPGPLPELHDGMSMNAYEVVA